MPQIKSNGKAIREKRDLRNLRSSTSCLRRQVIEKERYGSAEKVIEIIQYHTVIIDNDCVLLVVLVIPGPPGQPWEPKVSPCVIVKISTSTTISAGAVEPIELHMPCIIHNFPCLAMLAVLYTQAIIGVRELLCWSFSPHLSQFRVFKKYQLSILVEKGGMHWCT